jgi:hypothetical protein
MNRIERQAADKKTRAECEDGKIGRNKKETIFACFIAGNQRFPHLRVVICSLSGALIASRRSFLSVLFDGPYLDEDAALGKVSSILNERAHWHSRGSFYTTAPSTLAVLILSISGFRPKSHPIPSTISTRNFSLDFSIGKKAQKP